MKIRQGFVSNSSSSSFCILGVSVDNDTYDKVDSILFKDRILDVESAINDYDDSKYIGLNPSKMKDDETLGQFKDRIVSEAAKLGIIINKDEIDWITDGGYNG
jgi:hypothetical protein